MWKWNGSSEGIVKACFWAFARVGASPPPQTALAPSLRGSRSNGKKDVWAAFNLEQTTLIPTDSWVHDESVESVAAKGDLDDFCNLTLLSFARALNLLNGGHAASRSRRRSFGESARRLWRGLQL